MSGKMVLNGIEYVGNGGGSGSGNVDDVKVNGVSVVDANKEAQIKSYKEITQAQWEALPSTKLTDGIAYFITDSAGADGYPPLIYSDEEREIGVWRDGKPLYQKTITFTSVSKSGSLSLGISNVDKIFLASGECGIGLQLPYVHGSAPSHNVGGFFTITSQDTSWDFRSGDNAESTVSGFLTVQYTKTTDTPGSGKWTTQGTVAHHYSTDEHIIGTWIDGKPLYEKVLNLPNISVGVNTIQHGISNLASMISITGKCTYGDGTRGLCIPFLSSSTYWITCANITSSQFTLEIGNGLGSIQNCTITIQYTKTTD